MYGDGKSDRLIVAVKRSNKDRGVPWLAENVEPSGLTKGNSFQQNKFWTQCRDGSIWPTLNGHEARNRGHSQEIVPTSRRNLQRALKRIRQLHAGIGSSFLTRTATARHYLR